MALRATRRTARALQLRIDGGADDVTPRAKRFNEELRHQTLLFDRRAALMQEDYPDLRWLFATLNGIFIPPGLKKQVAESGLVAGVLDMWYPVARADRDGKHWCGLVLELKKLKGGRPSKEQLEWAAHLVKQGWRVAFPQGAVDAWWTLAAYAGITGRDNYAPDLQQQEEYIRLLSG